MNLHCMESLVNKLKLRARLISLLSLRDIPRERSKAGDVIESCKHADD